MKSFSLLRRTSRIAVLAGALGLTTGPAFADEVNLYTTREPGLIKTSSSMPIPRRKV